MSYKRKDMMPADVLRPILHAWVKEHEATYACEARGNYNAFRKRPLGGKEVLAAMAGIHARALYRVMCENTNVTFDLADRLLCAMDKQDMWHSDPTLNYWYTEGIDLRNKEEFRGSPEWVAMRAKDNARRRRERARAQAVPA